MYHHLKKSAAVLFVMIVLSLTLVSCFTNGQQKNRLSLFIGIDTSKSYVESGHFDDSISFLANYIYAHLNELGSLKKPSALFVSSIDRIDIENSIVFYPIHLFRNKSVQEIEGKLRELFPKEKQTIQPNFNAFFKQIALAIRNKNLEAYPVSVVMLSDGTPNIEENGISDFEKINLKPLERLSQNVTLRLLYTDPVTGKNWQTEIPRHSVKIWTQSAAVMTSWSDTTIFSQDSALITQKDWLKWTKENVDFGVRRQGD